MRETIGILCITLMSVLVASSQENMESKIRDLVHKMTLEEKISMLSGTGFDSRPVPRLGIPSLHMTDGPVGVRWENSTAFPASIAMGATWDPPLIGEVGRALGLEAAAKGRNMLLGPCININRVPVGGRSFESFGEDPYLMARMAAEYIRGVQSEHVVATAKHYAANNQEFERVSIDEKVDERALREIYFPAFKAAVEEGGCLAVMSAYNKVNGLWCSENPFLLTDILKKEWGFRGLVVSDWGAVHSTVPTANAGLDIEMPTGEFLSDSLLLPAVRKGDVPGSVIDDKVTRLLRVMLQIGLFDAREAPDAGIISGPEHRKLAREVEASGIVLLKNQDAVLPIDPSRVRSIAVIGPNAAIAATGGGGSALVSPPYSVSPLDGITSRAAGKIRIQYAQGCLLADQVTPMESTALRPAGGKPGEEGLRGEYFANQDLQGPPALTRVDRQVNFDWERGSPAKGIPDDHFSIRWTGSLVPLSTGEYDLIIRSDDGSRLYIDGKLLIDNWGIHGGVTKSARMAMEKGKAYDLKLEYFESTGGAMVQLGWQSATNSRLAEAVEAAKNADLAIVCIGNTSGIETEGTDRTTLALPAGQDELVQAIAKANPRTAVLLASGAPVLMPWIDGVPAVVQAWFGGQEVGNAVADILFGDVNPSGKMPVTFLKSWEDTPAYGAYPGKDGKTEYGEGIFVGYRWFDREHKDVLFPFGHGLSYTTFTYSNLGVTAPAGGSKYARAVEVTVANTGNRSGREVVQLYVGDGHAGVPRPPRELKAFAKVSLAPGEKKTVRLMLDESSFAFFHPQKKQWTVEPGKFEISVGSSSRDIRLKGTTEVK